MSASTRRLGPTVSPFWFASMIASRPVTWSDALGSPIFAAARIASAPLLALMSAAPAG